MEWLNKLTTGEWRSLVGEDAVCVLEVGSHDGEDTAVLLEAFPAAAFHCWEPDERPRRRFKDRFGNNSRISLYPEAVSDKNGSAVWYASHGEMVNDPCRAGFPVEMQEDWDASGSIMVPTGHWGNPAWLRFNEEDRVPTIALDTWLLDHDEIKRVDLLWADIQGAELKMIAGGRRLLAMTRYAYLEVYDCTLPPGHDGVAPHELYQGQPTFDSLCEALAGWTCLGFYNRDSVLFQNDHATVWI